MPNVAASCEKSLDFIAFSSIFTHYWIFIKLSQFVCLVNDWFFSPDFHKFYLLYCNVILQRYTLECRTNKCQCNHLRLRQSHFICNNSKCCIPYHRLSANLPIKKLILLQMTVKMYFTLIEKVFDSKPYENDVQFININVFAYTNAYVLFLLFRNSILF